MVRVGLIGGEAKGHEVVGDALDVLPADAEALAGFATATPKTADGEAEMIRRLKIAHDQAVEQRAAAMVTMKAMLVHAPDGLRHETAGKTQIALARHLAGLRPRQLEGPTLRTHSVTPCARWPSGGSTSMPRPKS
ncbi:hypothetical protein [Streptomyces sp. NPDC048419]|uniref:hypothetical protein n=1 Tax=Streptomyces sp. NPDC048419 TaxID=3365547 RepID=UPI003722136E